MAETTSTPCPSISASPSLTPRPVCAPPATPIVPSMTPIAPLFVGDRDVSFLNVVNIVATVNLDCPLDLIKICLSVRNAEYNPKRFSAVIMKILSPRTTALVFASGKLVITGAKSEEQSNLAARKYARIIQKIGFNVRFKNFKIHNIVGSCDFKFPINLEEFVFKHSQFCSYEPELFPGLVFRMIEPRIVLLIFVNGKVVLTGAKERAKIHEALNNIYPILKSLKKQ